MQTFLTDADSPDNKLRLAVVKAVSERDQDKLWLLTESYILSKSKKRTRTSAQTLKAYKAAIKKLVTEHWTDVNLLRPTKNDVSRLINDLESRYEIASQRVFIAAYKMLYRMLRFSGASEAIPFMDVVIQSDTVAPEFKRAAYTTDEVSRLLEVADRETSLIIVLGAYVGLRNSEISKLPWNLVNTSPAVGSSRAGRQEILVEFAKGNKTRRPPILGGIPLEVLSKHKSSTDKFVIMSIQKLKTASRKSDAIRDMIKTACIIAGVEYRGVQSFRHHCGTYLAEHGYSADEIKDFLGHSSVVTTERYIKAKRLDKFKAFEVTD